LIEIEGQKETCVEKCEDALDHEVLELSDDGSFTMLVD